jgi:TetR/AcrR family fatty acid metabolism transcriptional regulator
LAEPGPNEALEEEVASKSEELIIRSTYRLIGSKGMHRLTLQDVADSTDLSKSTVIYYYKTKENLVLTTMRWVLTQVTRRIREVISQVGSPDDRVRAMIDTIFIDPLRNRNFYLAYTDLIEYSARSHSFKNLSMTFRSNINSMYAEVIQLGIDEGTFEVTDAEEAAAVTRAMIDGLFLQWLQENDWRGTHAAYKDTCTHAVLSYLRR